MNASRYNRNNVEKVSCLKKGKTCCKLGLSNTGFKKNPSASDLEVVGRVPHLKILFVENECFQNLQTALFERHPNNGKTTCFTIRLSSFSKSQSLLRLVILTVYK